MSLSPSADPNESGSPEVVFAFGPKSTYFFEYNGNRKWNALPKGLLDLLQRKGNEKIVKTFCLAFAKQEGWLISYGDGEKNVKFGIPSSLKEWVMGTSPGFMRNPYSLDLKTLYVAINFDHGFFATARDVKGYVRISSKEVPDTFNTMIQCYIPTNCQTEEMWNVSFGGGGNHLLYPRRGPPDTDWTHSFNLHRDNFAVLDRIFITALEAQQNVFTWYIVLNPWIRDQFFLVKKDGSAEWNANKEFTKDIEEIARRILHDQTSHGSTVALQTMDNKRKRDINDEGGSENDLAQDGRVKSEDNEP